MHKIFTSLIPACAPLATDPLFRSLFAITVVTSCHRPPESIPAYQHLGHLLPPTPCVDPSFSAPWSPFATDPLCRSQFLSTLVTFCHRPPVSIPVYQQLGHLLPPTPCVDPSFSAPWSPFATDPLCRSQFISSLVTFCHRPPVSIPVSQHLGHLLPPTPCVDPSFSAPWSPFATDRLCRSQFISTLVTSCHRPPVSIPVYQHLGHLLSPTPCVDPSLSAPWLSPVTDPLCRSQFISTLVTSCHRPPVSIPVYQHLGHLLPPTPCVDPSFSAPWSPLATDPLCRSQFISTLVTSCHRPPVSIPVYQHLGHLLPPTPCVDPSLSAPWSPLATDPLCRSQFISTLVTSCHRPPVPIPVYQHPGHLLPPTPRVDPSFSAPWSPFATDPLCRSQRISTLVTFCHRPPISILVCHHLGHLLPPTPCVDPSLSAPWSPFATDPLCRSQLISTLVTFCHRPPVSIPAYQHLGHLLPPTPCVDPSFSAPLSPLATDPYFDPSLPSPWSSPVTDPLCRSQFISTLVISCHRPPVSIPVYQHLGHLLPPTPCVDPSLSAPWSPPATDPLCRSQLISTVVTFCHRPLCRSQLISTLVTFCHRHSVSIPAYQHLGHLLPPTPCVDPSLSAPWSSPVTDPLCRSQFISTLVTSCHRPPVSIPVDQHLGHLLPPTPCADPSLSAPWSSLATDPPCRSQFLSTLVTSCHRLPVSIPVSQHPSHLLPPTPCVDPSLSAAWSPLAIDPLCRSQFLSTLITSCHQPPYVIICSRQPISVQNVLPDTVGIKSDCSLATPLKSVPVVNQASKQIVCLIVSTKG